MIIYKHDLCVLRAGEVISRSRFGREIQLYKDHLTYISPYNGKKQEITGYFDSGSKGVKKALRYVASDLDRECWQQHIKRLAYSRRRKR